MFLIINKDKEIKAHFLIHEKFEETNYDVFENEDFWKQFLHVRLNTILPLSCEATISDVKTVLQSKRKKVFCYIFGWNNVKAKVVCFNQLVKVQFLPWKGYLLLPTNRVPMHSIICLHWCSAFLITILLSLWYWQLGFEFIVDIQSVQFISSTHWAQALLMPILSQFLLSVIARLKFSPSGLRIYCVHVKWGSCKFLQHFYSHCILLIFT